MVERKYSELYRYIDNDRNCNLYIQTEDIDSKMNLTFSVEDKVISNFDIKQMICHLLGIAVKMLNDPTDKRISFLYLCYNPKLIEIIDERKIARIHATYDQMCDECNAINFESLWQSILLYLSRELKVGIATDDEISVMLAKFKFTLCDQSDYLEHLK